MNALGISKWPMVALGDVCGLQNGFAFKSKLFRDAGTPILRISNIQSGGIVNTNLVFADPADYREDLSRFEVKFGDLLIAMSGATTGKIGFNQQKHCYFLNQRVGKFEPELSLNKKYLYHFLETKVADNLQVSSGVAQPNLSADQIRKMQIPLPPLDEQKRIAAILDKADSLRRQRREALALLDTLTQSIFIEMFGDRAASSAKFQDVNLSDVCEFYSGNTLPSGNIYSGQSTGFLLLKVSDLNLIGNERLITGANEWSREAGSKAGTSPANAVIFPKRGGAIGTNKKRLLTRPAILDPNLMAVAPDLKRIRPEFLFAWFGGFDLSDIASGSSVPQLNKKDLAPLPMRLPSIDLQVEFETKIDRLNKMRHPNENSLTHLDSLFASLQSRAFSGEL